MSILEADGKGGVLCTGIPGADSVEGAVEARGDAGGWQATTGPPSNAVSCGLTDLDYNNRRTNLTPAHK